MKKVLIISDTHGYLDPALQKYIDAADEVWHGGDIGGGDILEKIGRPVRAVYGNIDDQSMRARWPEVSSFTVEQVKVSIMHIAGYPGRYSTAAKRFIQSERPDIFVCGHSHLLKIVRDPESNALHINPGACGVHGFHHVRTAVRLTIDGNQIKDVAVIELGKRNKIN